MAGLNHRRGVVYSLRLDETLIGVCFPTSGHGSMIVDLSPSNLTPLEPAPDDGLFPDQYRFSAVRHTPHVSASTDHRTEADAILGGDKPVDLKTCVDALIAARKIQAQLDRMPPPSAPDPRIAIAQALACEWTRILIEGPAHFDSYTQVAVEAAELAAIGATELIAQLKKSVPV